MVDPQPEVHEDFRGDVPRSPNWAATCRPIALVPGAFKPEHAGKLSFYLSAVDAQIKGPGDGPTIGLLLCKTKNRLVAEYALSGSTKPMGVAEYQLVRALPEPLDTKLPTIEQLENDLAAVLLQQAPLEGEPLDEAAVASDLSWADGRRFEK